MDRDEFVALAHFHFTKNFQILARAALFADAGLLDQLHEWQRAAIQNGKFEVVQFHDGIIHSQADKRREQVLGGGDENALFHQAGGIADAGYIATDGLYLKTIQVDAAKDYACGGRGRKNSHADRRTTMQSDSTAFHS